MIFTKLSSAAILSLLIASHVHAIDNDGDGVSDDADNCPTVTNAGQADINNDGFGDACLDPAAQRWYFSYSFDDLNDSPPDEAESISGFLLGTIAEDGDTVFISGFSQVKFGGATWNRIYPSEIRAVTHGQQATASLSGTTLDFWVCPNGFTGQFLGGGDCAFGTEGGFLISNTVAIGTEIGDARAGDGADGRSTDDQVGLGWSLSSPDDDGDDGVVAYEDNCPNVNNPQQEQSACLDPSAQRWYFSYSFDDLNDLTTDVADSISGILLGTITEDGDTILISGFRSMEFNGVTWDRIYPSDIRAITAGEQAKASLSGDTLDFWVCPNGFTSDLLDGGDCGFGSEGGFLISNTIARLGVGIGEARAGDGNDGRSTDDQVGAGWSLISPDDDGDEVPAYLDNCPHVYNLDQADFDADGAGDACDNSFSAISLQFSYTFLQDIEAGEDTVQRSVSGILVGTVQDDDDTVIVDAIKVLTYSDTNEPDVILPPAGATVLRATIPGDSPRTSFSGDLQDFWSCPYGFTEKTIGGGDCPFLLEGGVILSTSAPFAASPIFYAAAAPGDGVRRSQDTIDPGSWLLYIDKDEDGVEDTVDNCPSVANPDQTDANGDDIGDECLSPLETESFVFRYVFAGSSDGGASNGVVISGSIDGFLQADNSTVIINGFRNVVFRGLPYPDINLPSEVRATVIGDKPVASLDGSALDFWVCPSGFTSIYLGGGDCSFTNEPGFLFSRTIALGDLAGDARAGDGNGPTGRATDDSVDDGVWYMDADPDDDGFGTREDNCPGVVNPAQQDTDGDQKGDTCDPDDDNDGLSDEEEDTLGTMPLVADTDADGLIDGQEIDLGTNPLEPDSDDDGYSDGDEHDAGSDPLDADDQPPLSGLNLIIIKSALDRKAGN